MIRSLVNVMSQCFISKTLDSKAVFQSMSAKVHYSVCSDQNQLRYWINSSLLTASFLGLEIFAILIYPRQRENQQSCSKRSSLSNYRILYIFVTGSGIRNRIESQAKNLI